MGPGDTLVASLRRAFCLSWLAALACFTGPTAAANRPTIPPRDFTDQKAHQVLAVHSINEIDVNLNGFEIRVKLAGVQPMKTDQADEKLLQARARAFLRNLLRGESVYIDQEQTRRKSSARNEFHAQVFRSPDGLSVNLELIRQGYAQHDDRRKHRFLAVFAYYEGDARLNERGLWLRPSTDRPGSENDSSEKNAEPETPEKEKPEKQKKDTQGTVWLSKTGSRYHTESCAHLRGSQKTTTRTAAQDAGLQPCKVCKPDS